MSFYGFLAGRGPSGFGANSTAEEVTAGLDLSGKTILITGAAAGLGRESARVLAARGAHIIATARTQERAAEALGKIGAEGTAIACDLSEPASVRNCVKAVKELGRPLDVILCNAGIMALPKFVAKYGYEMQFFTNHIGHYILVTGLLDDLADDGRVVMLSSRAHMQAPKEGIDFISLTERSRYGRFRAYGQSKLANMLFAKALARRFDGTRRRAFAVHPGVIKTGLWNHMPGVVNASYHAIAWMLFKNVPQGAATQCYVATSPNVTHLSGLYFADCNVATPSRNGQNAELAAKLWEESAAIAAKLT